MKVDIFHDWSYKLIGLLVGIIVFAFAAIVINTQAHGWVAWYRLATDGQTAEATITAKQTQVHQSCEFEYIVGAIHHRGVDQGCRLEIGQRVLITYLPTDPSFATTASPTRELATLILGPMALAFLGGTLSAWGIRRRGRRTA
jgi:hypothetical protein